MEPYYPPPAFHFSVTVIGAGAGSPSPSVDASFQEVAGIEAKMEVEHVNEGGENRFPHRLPRYVSYPNLVLRRGLVPSGSGLAAWIFRTLGGGLAVPVETRSLKVALLNDQGSPTLSWTFERAFPLRWELGSLNSQDNKLLIETLELSYSYFFRS
jgi:phage tail-like protein